jgi:hypothetical protein
MESHGGMILTGENEELEEKPDKCKFVHHISHMN